MIAIQLTDLEDTLRMFLSTSDGNWRYKKICIVPRDPFYPPQELVDQRRFDIHQHHHIFLKL